MLLTITTTHSPATDLGFLLHKHPARVQAVELSFGQAHVFYPEANEGRCTAALLLELDPVGLVRGRRGPKGEGGSLDHYVNDRPYVASSFLSVAIASTFKSALNGACKERPELVDQVMPLVARLPVVPARGGEALIRRLFEPLGYSVTVTRHELELSAGEREPSRYYTVELAAEKRLVDLLGHIYVLAPVLDDDKHYWVNEDEIEKLLRHGERWLPAHPERELIARRYLRHQKVLANDALERLQADDAPHTNELERAHDDAEASLEKKTGLNETRLQRVADTLAASGAKRVLDLGCGEGRLIKLLLDRPAFTEVVGVDVSTRALEHAQERLNVDRLPEAVRARLKLLHGSLIYRDKRLAGFDAAALVEVIEHFDRPRLAALERVVFEHARPASVVVTTPNVEFNARFEGLAAGALRHADHRFEWTRAEFAAWSGSICTRFGYRVEHGPIGEVDPQLGPPTQMAVFSR